MDSTNLQERTARALREALIDYELVDPKKATEAAIPASQWTGVLSWDDEAYPEEERVLAVIHCEQGVSVPSFPDQDEGGSVFYIWEAVVARVSQALGFAIAIEPVGYTHAEVMRAVEGPDRDWTELWSRSTPAGPCPF